LIYNKLRIELKKSFDFIWIFKTNVRIFVQHFKSMEKFEITVDYENQVTIIKHVESGTETKVSLSFTLIDCIKLVMSK